MRSPLHSEAELRHYDTKQNAQQYAYDLTARLTYFVVSAELVFCGYVLLNAEQFGAVKYSDALFLISGLAAFFGVFWRFSYNQTYHDRAHDKTPMKSLLTFQLIVYWLYVTLTIIFFTTLLWVGYVHLSNIAAKTVESKAAAQVANDTAIQRAELNKTSKPTQ